MNSLRMKNNCTDIRSLLIESAESGFEFQKKSFQIYPFTSIYPYLKENPPLLKASNNLLFLLETGCLTMQIGTELYHISDSSVVFISTGTIYELQEMNADVRGYLLQVDDRIVTGITNNKTTFNLSLMEAVMPIEITTMSWFMRVADLEYEEIMRSVSNRYVGFSLLRAMLYKLLELSVVERKQSREQQIVAQFKILLDEHVVKEHHTAFYAKALSISPNYLNRCVHGVFSKNAREVIMETRILLAGLMLINTGNDVSEVAYDLNFDDPSYFSRLFKKITGQSPSDYRARYMHSQS